MDAREHLENLAMALGGAPRGWHGKLSRAQDPALLDGLGRALTGWWRGRALAASRAQLRSPLYRTVKPLPGGARALYTYERSLWPVPLEASFQAPAGWEGEALVCRNLPAAYSTLLVSLQDLQIQPATVRCWRPPHELPALLDCLAPGRWSQALSERTLESSVHNGRADLFILSGAALCPPGGVLVVEGDVDMEKLLAAGGPWLVAVLRRWDAQRSLGLELSMPGEVRLYAPRSLAEPLTPLATASELARRVRSVVGACPSYAELWEWCLPEFDGQAYRLKVAENQARVGVLPLPVDLDDFRRRAARRGILEGCQRGAIGHRYQVTPGGIIVGAGFLPIELLDDLPSSRARVARSRAPVWPEEPAFFLPESTWLRSVWQWRQATLRVADQAAPLANLEDRLLAYDQAPPGQELHGLLFSSTMAALTALAMLMPRLTSEARYFETTFLNQVLRSRGTDVRWLESVQYDWELTPWDLQLDECPAVLVLDTTLTGRKLRLHDVLQHHRPQLAVRVFSALKLDQRGQELENAGAVLLCGSPAVVLPIKQALQALRRSLGAEPVGSRLSPPWVLQADDGHAQRVFDNNAWLAARLHPGGLLRRVVHPSLTSVLPWSVAPFCVLHLSDDRMECHRYLSALIERLARSVPFDRGASFGFVAHRHEFIVPVLKDQRALFKVAMGSSLGPSRSQVLAILQEALAYPDLRALRQANPDLRPVPVAPDWSIPSPRMVRYLAGSQPGTVQQTL